jgi:hypothetical protein
MTPQLSKQVAHFLIVTQQVIARTDRPRFDNVYCSQCGEAFGPGYSGFSRCSSHAGNRVTA